MAELLVEGQKLVVRLSLWERLWALRGNVAVPLAAVTAVSVEPNPYRALRGERSPGVRVNGVMAYGTWRSSLPQRDLVAVHGPMPAVKVALNDSARFGLILATVADARATERKLVEAAGLSRHQAELGGQDKADGKGEDA